MDQIRQQLRTIETELKQQEDNAELWMEYGVGHHLLGEYQTAIESFRKSLVIDNDNYRCHFNLANSLVESGHVEKAVHHFLEAIDNKPDHIPSFNNLADAYDLLEKPEKAHEIFQYVVHLNPDDPISHFNLGNFFLRNNQHIEAAKCYKKTISLDNSFADAYYNIALILNEVNAKEEALGYANDGLAVDPDHEELQKLAGKIRRGK